ncbi:hypothetical protein RA210_U50220 [Rubrivivax sp. A210]|nr:hypothetical protein RA210_U50220 [Rubrivivax sp. A210]
MSPVPDAAAAQGAPRQPRRRTRFHGLRCMPVRTGGLGRAGRHAPFSPCLLPCWPKPRSS